MKTAPLTLTLTLTLTLLCFASLTATAQPRLTTLDLERRGPHRVEEEDRVWVDATRARTIQVRIFAPVPAPGVRHPLIVFSHGLGGSHTGYRYFGEHLASHGFVVIHANHPGSDQVVARQGLVALLRAGRNPQNRVDRPLDVSFVLDQVERPGAHDALLRQVDMSQVGVAGHSFGAYTALAMVGQTIRQRRRTLSFRDDRVRCALAMSTQAPGTFDLTAGSWATIRVPVYTLTGTKDVKLGNLVSRHIDSRRVAFDSMPPGKKYHLNIDAATHSAFGDRPRATRDPRHHPWILAAATGFFRATLKGDSEATAWLDRDQLERDTLSEVDQERR